MADANITVEVSTQAAQAELQRLRAENARLAREAHTWWTALAGATAEIEQWRRAAERERCGDVWRCALEALDYCIEDSAELLSERTTQWGERHKDRQAAMAATLERHRAVAERLRRVLGDDA
jgi:phage shock protein A